MNTSSAGAGFGARDLSSSANSGRPGVNLSRMIRLDEVEDILNTMMRRLDAQESTIVSLQRLCSSLLPKAAANDAFENMQNTIRDLSSRLEDVAAAATSNIGTGRDMPAGELAYLNHVHIQQLSAQVATCARQAEILASLKKLEEDTEAGLARVRSQSTPLELGESLRRAQLDTSTRVTTVEAGLVQKVDRSEVGQLTSLASALESYSNFRTVTEATLRLQNETNQQVRSDLAAHGTDIQVATEDRNQLREQAKLFATLEQTEELATALRSVTGMTNLCASKKAVNELFEVVRAEQQRSSRAEEFANILGQRIDDADKAIATKASIEDNKKCVLRRHYDEAVTALGHDIDTKASNEGLSRTDNRVAILEAELEKESSKLAVAMRFVDWFTSRGENYEHNLRLVDKHLGKLTQAANPQERTPYEGQVRYAANIMSGSPAARFGGSHASNLANVPMPPVPTNNIGTSFSHVL